MVKSGLKKRNFLWICGFHSVFLEWAICLTKNLERKKTSLGCHFLSQNERKIPRKLIVSDQPISLRIFDIISLLISIFDVKQTLRYSMLMSCVFQYVLRLFQHADYGCIILFIFYNPSRFELDWELILYSYELTWLSPWIAPSFNFITVGALLK